MRYLATLAFAALISGCVSIPDGISPVSGFDADRYLGTWYEIARLDHRFERGLSDVSATYSKRPDGGIRVVNRGFDTERGQWDEAVGKAYFVDEADTGFLKVSFFGPFYGSYIVFELDESYEYSFVSGPNRQYLWLLSRNPQADPEVLAHFRSHAGELGFDTSGLILVEHTRATVGAVN